MKCSPKCIRIEKSHYVFGELLLPNIPITNRFGDYEMLIDDVFRLTLLHCFIIIARLCTFKYFFFRLNLFNRRVQ